ncbi:group 10 secretory phospholipase A2, partial [Gracilinanus agilis]|uniref:group 10 secretory phospholipase A2 n=1 Tax=Gracilinanus agilis TaxID=191870 RepID=UPI001CFC81EA
MESIPLLLLLLFAMVSGKSLVHRRGLLDLASVINCPGKIPALAFIHYGCYCGWGGSGQPRDQIDWCCQKHDCCYNRADKAGCSPKWQRYDWNCTANRVECASSENKCQEITCKCDQELSNCLAAAGKYNKNYVLHQDCGTESPKCE